MEILEAQIQKVKLARLNLRAVKEELDDARLAFEVANADLLASERQAKEDLDLSEVELRSLVLEAYQATGSKKPAPGVGVRIVKKLRYDENSIKQWAISNGHIMFLALDKAGFEGWAKAMIPRGLPESLLESGAAIREDEAAQATIAKEL